MRRFDWLGASCALWMLVAGCSGTQKAGTHVSRSTVTLCEGVQCPDITVCPDGSMPTLQPGECCETCGGSGGGTTMCDPAYGLCQADSDCPQVQGTPLNLVCQNGCCVPNVMGRCDNGTCPDGTVPVFYDGTCHCEPPPIPGQCCDGTFGECMTADQCPQFGSGIPVDCINGCCVPVPCDPNTNPNCGCICPVPPPCQPGETCPPPPDCMCPPPPPPCDPATDPNCCVCPAPEPCPDGQMCPPPPCMCPPPPCQPGDPTCCQAGDPNCCICPLPPPCVPGEPCPPPPPCDCPPPPPCDPATDPMCCRAGDPNCPPPPPPCDPATGQNCCDPATDPYCCAGGIPCPPPPCDPMTDPNCQPMPLQSRRSQ